MKPPLSTAHETSANYTEHQPNVSASRGTDRLAIPLQNMNEGRQRRLQCSERRTWCSVHLLGRNLKTKFLLFPLMLFVLGEFFIFFQFQGYFNQSYSSDENHTPRKNYSLCDYEAVYSLQFWRYA